MFAFRGNPFIADREPENAGGSLDNYYGGPSVQLGNLLYYGTREAIRAINVYTGQRINYEVQVNGPVLAMGTDGTDIYIGGDFTTVAGSTTRNNAASLSTGGTVNAWNPNVKLASSAANARVDAMTIINGIIYIGGDFDDIGGTTRNYAAALNSSGTLQSWDPNLNGPVLGMDSILHASVYYIYMVGPFTTANGGTARDNFCLYNASGTLQGWNPSATGGEPIDIAVVNFNEVYVVGDFTAINGTTRNKAAKLNSSGTGGPTSGWDPNIGLGGTYPAVVSVTAASSGITDYIAITGPFDQYAGGSRFQANGMQIYNQSGTLLYNWPYDVNATRPVSIDENTTIGCTKSFSGSTWVYGPATPILKNGDVERWIVPCVDPVTAGTDIALLTAIDVTGPRPLNQTDLNFGDHA